MLRRGRFLGMGAALTALGALAVYVWVGSRLAAPTHGPAPPPPAYVLVASGSLDRRTTEAETRRLFAAARQPKELWIVDGASHQDLYSFDPETYASTVLSFLRRYLG